MDVDDTVYFADNNDDAYSIWCTNMANMDFHGIAGNWFYFHDMDCRKDLQNRNPDVWAKG